MDKIIPRWEWRTFGSKFGVSEEKIQNHKLGNFKRSSEKYILSKNSNDNCKIRDDLMDIKRLKQVSAAIAQIDKEFAAAGVEGHPDQLVGMGGTVTSMGAVKHKMVKYDPDVIQGSTLTKADISEQIEATTAPAPSSSARSFPACSRSARTSYSPAHASSTS